MLDPWVLAPLVLMTAALYASVGHGGASAYLALLVLAGCAAASVAPTVLAVNVIVAGIAFASYRAAGHLDVKLLASFAAASVPAAFVGGMVRLGPGMHEAL